MQESSESQSNQFTVGNVLTEYVNNIKKKHKGKFFIENQRRKSSYSPCQQQAKRLSQSQSSSAYYEIPNGKYSLPGLFNKTEQIEKIIAEEDEDMGLNLVSLQSASQQSLKNNQQNSNQHSKNSPEIISTMDLLPEENDQEIVISKYNLQSEQWYQDDADVDSRNPSFFGDNSQSYRMKGSFNSFLKQNMMSEEQKEQLRIQNEVKALKIEELRQEQQKYNGYDKTLKQEQLLFDLGIGLKEKLQELQLLIQQLDNVESGMDEAQYKIDKFQFDYQIWFQKYQKIIDLIHNIERLRQKCQ